MDSEKIISYLDNYQNIGHEELLEVSALQKKYPWFSILYGLESKCLKNENKFGLKKAIKRASLFSGNREILYDLIHDEILFEPSKTSKKEPVKIDVPEPEPKETPIDVKEQTIKESSSIEEPALVKAKLPDLAKQEVLEVSEAIKNSKTDTEPLPIKKTTEPVKEVVAPSKDKTVPAYDPLIELQKFVKPQEEKQKEEDKPVLVKKPYDPEIELVKLEKAQTLPKPEKQDFFGWLDSFAEEEEKEEPKPRKLKMSAEASEMLSNFIKNRPKMTKMRKDVDPLEVYNSSKESAGNELVTESLAQLHLKQERPDKAIEIYEKMSLQNPQKMTYFAALIEKIKKDYNLE